MALQERLAAIAAEHKKRQDAINAALTDETKARIADAATEKAAQYFSDLLSLGHSEEEATQLAVDEARRHEAHLLETAALHADSSSRKETVMCVACKTDTPHTVVTDKNGEYVATCACGRWKKYPADHVW